MNKWRAGLVTTIAAVLMVSGAAGLADARPFSRVDGTLNWGYGRYVCSHAGGRFGVGYMRVVAGIAKTGKNGTNYFKIEFTREWSEGGAWHQDRQYTRESAHFPDDARHQLYTPSWTFPFTADEIGRTYRFKLKYRWIHASFGPDYAKKKATEYAGNCTPSGDGSLGPAPGGALT